MKKLMWLLAAAALLGSGAYVFVYLYRWEFHRTLIVGMFFLAMEIAIVGALVLRRLDRLQQQTASAPPAATEALRRRLHEAAPERDHFAWLQPHDGRLGVFIPVLLGAGVVVSALAWGVEKVAGRGAEAGFEQRLAERLVPIAFPAEPLVPEDAELLAQEGPYGEDPALRLLLGPGAGP